MLCPLDGETIIRNPYKDVNTDTKQDRSAEQPTGESAAWSGHMMALPDGSVESCSAADIFWWRSELHHLPDQEIDQGELGNGDARADLAYRMAKNSHSLDPV